MRGIGLACIRLWLAAERQGAGALPDGTPLETRWIFAKLHAVAAGVERSLADYRFDEAAQAVYQFFWGEFCDWYLELVKLRLNFEGEKSPETALTLGALVSVFEAALRLLSPFMPFLTEELWHALHLQVGVDAPAKSIALTRYPQPGDFPADATSVEAMETLQELVVTVRALRKELGVPEKEAAPIQVHASNRIAALVDAHGDSAGAVGSCEWCGVGECMRSVVAAMRALQRLSMWLLLYRAAGGCR